MVKHGIANADRIERRKNENTKTEQKPESKTT